MDRDRPAEGAHSQGDSEPKAAQATAEQVAADVRERAEAQRFHAADSAQHAAHSARQAARELHGEEAWLAALVEQGADKLADFAQTLRNNDLSTLLARTEDFARRQPVLFAGAAMALGFALTRAVAVAQHGGAAAYGSRGQETRHGV